MELATLIMVAGCVVFNLFTLWYLEHITKRIEEPTKPAITPTLPKEKEQKKVAEEQDEFKSDIAKQVMHQWYGITTKEDKK